MQVIKDLAKAAAEESVKVAQEQADAAGESKARADASVRGTVCVPDDRFIDRTRKVAGYDQTKWMTIVASEYPNWNPKGRFIRSLLLRMAGPVP